MMTMLTILTLWLLLGAIVAAATGSASWRGWIYQLLIAIDQMLNILATPWHSGAWADETLSARAWRAYTDGRIWGRAAVPVIDLLFRWQGPGHCEAAHLNEQRRGHLPPELRD